MKNDLSAVSVPATHSSTAAIDERASKRRAYLTYFAVLLASVLLLGRSLPLFDPSITVVADAILPPTLAFFAICLVVLWRRPDLLRVVEVVQYAAYYPILLGLLTLMLSNTTTEAGRHGAVSSFAVWIPIVVVWAFIVFGSRGGPVAAFGFIAATGAVIGIHHAVGQPLGTAGSVVALQSAVASSVFVVLLYTLTRQLERQTANRIEAEVAADYAVRDVLTGAFTRFALGVRFEQALALAHRAHRRLAVFFIDIDGFKRVNDDFGHAAGDDLLREVAGRIAAAVRDADTVARLGGDEFVVLAFVDDSSHVARIADRLVAVGAEPFDHHGLAVDFGASVGVSVYPYDAESAETLLAYADSAMYAAKVAGKRRWALASQAAPVPEAHPAESRP